MILFLELCWVTVSKILMFWNFNLDPIFLTHVNLRSRSIFLSLDWKNSGRRGETKREPDTNLLWNVYDPLFFYWWTFTETANQNYFRSAILASSRACSTAVKEQWKAILLTAINCTFLRSCVLMAINCTFLRSCLLFLDVEYFSFYCIEGAQLKY